MNTKKAIYRNEKSHAYTGMAVIKILTIIYRFNPVIMNRNKRSRKLFVGIRFMPTLFCENGKNGINVLCPDM